MNFIQIYANFCWCHIDINAVTRVFHEFSCQRVFFIMYNFYIATCAIFLGVLWKKPHQNWIIFWQTKWQIADRGSNDVSGNITQQAEHTTSNWTEYILMRYPSKEDPKFSALLFRRVNLDLFRQVAWSIPCTSLSCTPLAWCIFSSIGEIFALCLLCRLNVLYVDVEISTRSSSRASEEFLYWLISPHSR